MTGEALYCRARPDGIRLEERHEYLTELGGLARTRYRGASRGEIEARVPYDGREGFTREALGDLERQRADGARATVACIGRLAFANAGATDLEARLALSTRHDNVPLEIPLEGAGLASPEDLVADRTSAVLRLAYRPEAPAGIPLVVSARLADEEPLAEALLERLARGDGAVARLLAGALGRPPAGPGRMRLTLWIELRLPVRLAQVPARARLALERAPAASPRALCARLLEAEPRILPVRLAPDRRRLELPALELVPPEEADPATGLFHHALPPLELAFLEPGELALGGSLEGELVLEVPHALSGLELRWHGATGASRPAVPLQARTTLASRLRISLAELQRRRPVSSYRRLRFEGVLVEELPLVDVAGLLEERGFEVRRLPLEGEARPGSTRSELLFARRRLGPVPLVLLLLAEGSRSRMLVRTRLAGGKSLESEAETGVTLVHLRAQAEGEPARLAAELGAVQQLLKERLRGAGTLD